ncbi:MAG: hypothetical protein J0I42_20200 [Bosea sp.]|uniref:hypothetical protein n=1 Tax=Bosea sp. (in: a-proteobacteria) TaxID=1871050 RepID=UPI001AD1A800|nr:hypothetical protein [Bosea sp. (in: a-proteobacteria)]MBN9454265.1 hypothetical protein [Bosea sp. (in: a-proteobacteria)]
MTPAERLGIEAEQEAFNKALLGEDDLGMVVRAHIHIESRLSEFIEARLVQPEQLELSKVPFEMRVRLALALGLSDKFKSALNFVGTLRNKFAHTLTASLGEEEATNFERALGSEGKQIRDKSYKSTKAKLAADKPSSPSGLEPRDKIVLSFVTLWGGIAVAAVRAKAAAARD